MRCLSPNAKWWPTWADVFPNIALMPKIEASTFIMHVSMANQMTTRVCMYLLHTCMPFVFVNADYQPCKRVSSASALKQCIDIQTQALFSLKIRNLAKCAKSMQASQIVQSQDDICRKNMRTLIRHGKFVHDMFVVLHVLHFTSRQDVHSYVSECRVMMMRLYHSSMAKPYIKQPRTLPHLSGHKATTTRTLNAAGSISLPYTPSCKACMARIMEGCR